MCFWGLWGSLCSLLRGIGTAPPTPWNMLLYYSLWPVCPSSSSEQRAGRLPGSDNPPVYSHAALRKDQESAPPNAAQTQATKLVRAAGARHMPAEARLLFLPLPVPPLPSILPLLGPLPSTPYPLSCLACAAAWLCSADPCIKLSAGRDRNEWDCVRKSVCERVCVRSMKQITTTTWLPVLS